MRTVDRLLAASASIWEDCYRHPFVQGLADGTLGVDRFRFYIIQDYLYLVDYAKVFAVGITKAQSLDVMKLFSGYIHRIFHGEMDIHNGYVETLKITQEEIDTMPVSLDSRSYTSYMLAVAHDGTATDALVAILSCALSYEEIGRRIAAEHPEALDHPVFGEWVRGYASERYHQDNVLLVEMLERLTQGITEAELTRLEEIFCISSRYELSFWDMAWEKRL